MLDKIYAEQVKVIKTKVVSIDTTVSKIYNTQVELIKLDKDARRRQEQERKRNEGDKRSLQSILAKDKDEKKNKEKDNKGGWLGKILAGFLGGSLIKSLLSGIFGPKGLLGTLIRSLFGERGLVNSLMKGLFGKEGLFIKAWSALTSKDGLLAKSFSKIFGKEGALGKTFTKLKTSLDDLIKKLPGGKFLKNLGNKLPKFLKGAKGGGILAALVSGGFKFAETGDTGQAVTQGAGAGLGALGGGALGALTGPLAPIMVPLGAAVGGIIGDFVTEELRKLGWLKPIEDTINGVVDVFRKFSNWMTPFFEGYIESWGELFTEIGKTFEVGQAVFGRVIEDIQFVFEKITETLSSWWTSFNDNIITPISDTLSSWWSSLETNILIPMGERFGQVLEFLDPMIKPLRLLAEKILTPLAAGMELLFEVIKKIPVIGNMFNDEEDRRNAGGLVGDIQTSGFRAVLELVQQMGTAYVNRQTGGPILVPGSQATSGDSVPALLPTGSFVLNRNASNAIRRQEGGSVPAMLEPGELVFPKTTNSLKSLNSSIPRFQIGGVVNHPDTGPGFQPGDAKDASGRPVVLSKGASDAFKKMMDAGGVKGSDVASSRRSVEKNKSVGGVANSAHLGGNAIDIHGTSKAWMINNSDNFGWKRNNYMNDSWHWDYVGKNSNVIGKNEGSDDKSENKETEEKAFSPMNLLSGLSGSISGSLGGQLGFLKMFGIDLTGMASDIADSFGLGASPPSDSIIGPRSDSANSTKPYEIADSMGFEKKDWDIYRNIVGNIESGNVYDISGGSGDHYDGRWQLGADAKTDAANYLGERDPGHNLISRLKFQKDADMQERYFAAFTAKNHSYLTGLPEYDSLSTKKKFEVLGYAHNQGAGGAASWLTSGEVRRDGFGTAATKYSKALSAAYGKQRGGVIGFNEGGQVPTVLEPGELVFPSSSPHLEALNSSIPRFQTGGSNSISHSSSPSMDKLGAASGMSMGQTSIIVINGGGGKQQATAPPQLPQSQGVAPPMLPNGPSMAGLSDIINRVSWSNVF